MRRHLFATGLVIAVALCGAVHAGPPTSFTSFAVSDAGALADDPNLAGRIQNLMSVTVAGGGDWTSSYIRIQLTTGTVYNATNAVGTDSSPTPAFWTIPGFRNGPYDTFVNSKGAGGSPDANPTAATILGVVNADGSLGPPPALGLTSNNATLVSVQWGNSVVGESGTFSVGRFTLSATATGTYFGQSFDSLGGSVGTPFSGTIVSGVLTPVPEPAGILVLAAGLGLAVLRRCRACPPP